jgi:hypothetical protein
MTEIRKTIYITEERLEELGEYKNFSHRVNDLILKGLQYEKDNGKITLEQALGYFNNLYRRKHPNKPLP